MVTIPLMHSSPKLQPLPQPCKPERTSHGQIPCQPLLTEVKGRGQDPTKDSSYPPYNGKQATQGKAEEMCRWGPHCPICAKSTPNLKAGSSEDWNSKRQNQWQRNYYPQSPQYSPSYDILDRLSEHHKTEEGRKERLEFLNDKYNLDYYSSADSDSESEQMEHRYEILI